MNSPNKGAQFITTVLRYLTRFSEILDKYGIRLVIVGRWELLPERVQIAAQKALERTKDNTRFVYP